MKDKLKYYEPLFEEITCSDDIKPATGIRKILEENPPKIFGTNKLTEEDLIKFLNTLYERSKLQRENQIKRDKAVIKHLVNKSKELGKEIPIELSIIMSRNLLQGSWFFEKYKEWL